MTPREKLEALGFELVDTTINGKCSRFRFQHEITNNVLTFYRNGNDPVVVFSSYIDYCTWDDEPPQEEPYGLTLKEMDAVSAYMKFLEKGLDQCLDTE